MVSEETKNPVGRPEVYSSTDMWSEWIEEWKTISVDTYEEGKLKVQLPTIESLALFLRDKLKQDRKIDANNISVATIERYAKKEESKPEFCSALTFIKYEQKRRLLNDGLSGRYNSTIAKLILSANHGMHEKTETESNLNITDMGRILKDGKDLKVEIG